MTKRLSAAARDCRDSRLYLKTSSRITEASWKRKLRLFCGHFLIVYDEVRRSARRLKAFLKGLNRLVNADCRIGRGIDIDKRGA